MRTIFKSNISFFSFYLTFLFFGGLLLSISSKTNIHLAFNSFHTPALDQFFFYFTNLGDGIMAFLVVIILLAVKYRFALIVGVSNFVASLITQLLKQTVFSSELRPKKFFEGIHELYFVPGVENHLYYSFPSGHSTCAFSLYLSLSLIAKGHIYKVFFFVIALLVGLSRIYLSQHFFADVYFGSLIGVVVTLVVYWLISKMDAPGLERSLISSF